jgi:Protein of unknown function (DUF3775)
MLHAIRADEIREIAARAKGARAAQHRLLDKMRIVDQFEDHKELTSEISATLDALDATLDNQPLLDLRARLASLNENARLELGAVALIGRGDYSAQQWDAALDEARARPDANDPDSLALKPNLAEYLSKGLFLVSAD